MLVYEDDDHWLTFTQGPLYHLSNVIQPLESTWRFSCPLIGPDSRYSVSFRASLRSGMRKTIKEGVEFERLSSNLDGISILNRVLSVEMRSWKQGAGESVFRHHDHYQFYRNLIGRTASKGLLRAVFSS